MRATHWRPTFPLHRRLASVDPNPEWEEAWAKRPTEERPRVLREGLHGFPAKRL